MTTGPKPPAEVTIEPSLVRALLQEQHRVSTRASQVSYTSQVGLPFDLESVVVTARDGMPHSCSLAQGVPAPP